ncbi:hypothetical protein DQ384_09895 [Sphaerisporangium album]|uniref:Uncharacterized protein n=1 Tax=Sphaerisporangium album TaxID=509200 RepID=A0A367FQ64_9ACTN|nr:hypothetical protein [Sphaerisporangium album]RCG31830.1 hypothetical protein DQ384_09895 [Sphaerisporangium album]
MSLASLGAVALPANVSVADTDNFAYTYSCKRKLSDVYETLKVQVSVPKSVHVGEPLAVTWNVTSSDVTSPASFKAGGKVSFTGSVVVDGLWKGELDSDGTKDQAELASGQKLVLPSGVSGAVSTTKEGKITVIPKDVVIDFTPPAGSALINDDAGDTEPESPGAGNHDHEAIKYTGKWFYSGETDPSRAGDHEKDVHATDQVSDRALVTFVGTGIEYITERYKDMGAVEIRLDKESAPSVERDASKDVNGSPAEERESKQVLWSVHDLPYGEHRLWLINKAAAPGKYMLVDAFNVITDPLSSPAEYYRATCTSNDDLMPVTVDVLPPVKDSNDGNNDGDGHISDGDDSVRGVVVLSGGGQGHGAPTATATATKTVTPKPKASSTPQVRVTPKGGAHTGEASDRDNGTASLLIGYGTALALGGLGGRLLLRRRRAAHRSTGRGSLG